MIELFEAPPSDEAQKDAMQKRRDPSPHKKLHSATLTYLVFVLCAAVYLLPFMRVMLPHTNEGSLIYGAVRILNGEVFARDFFEVMGPGTIYITALFLKLFGLTFLATRVWLFLTSLCTAICVYHLSWRVCPRHAILPCLIFAGACYGMQWPSISHHVDSNAFALLAVVCLAKWGDNDHASLLVVAGIFTGVTASIHLPKGLFLLAALVAWMALRKKLNRHSFVQAGTFLTGVALVLASVGVYFSYKHALGALIYDNFIWPSVHYGKVNEVPYAMGIFSQYWNHWARIPGMSYWPAAMASVLTTPFLFIASLPVLFLVLLLKFKRLADDPAVLLCLLGGTALWCSEFHRKDIYHLVFGSPLLLIVSIWFAAEYRHRAVKGVLQIFAITSSCLLVFNLLQVLLVHDMNTNAGRVGMFKPDPILPAVLSKVRPGDDAFFYPYCPMYYFLTETVNPTRFSILAYQYNTRDQFDDAIASIEARRVPFVVWDREFQRITAASVFPQARPVAPSDLIMERYIQTHYHQVAGDSKLALMQRNDDQEFPR